MKYTIKDILEFIRVNDIKFIRLAFCDLFGQQKNIVILSDQLERIFQQGLPFDATAIRGFEDELGSDLLLYPIPSTLNMLPWRPQQGRVGRLFCDMKHLDQAPYIGDTRNLLKAAEKRCAQMGYSCQIGTDCEFYLFQLDENGEPTHIPLDEGGYLDIYPLDRGENVRREICLCLEEMDISPKSSHHERGPGQNEIDFKHSDPLAAADNFLTFKSVVKAIAARNGLFASFLPKPMKGKSGSRLRINLSLLKNGSNLFQNIGAQGAWEGRSFIAGILDKLPDITAFLNPLQNSYERFADFEEQKYVLWSRQNRRQLVKISEGRGVQSRLELSCADPVLNPYLAFALMIHAGLDGIEQKMELMNAQNSDLNATKESDDQKADRLPQNLEEAIALAGQSSFIQRIIGKEILSRYISQKQTELEKNHKVEQKETFCTGHDFKVF